jgi:iron complex outermembrane receptor protein
MRLATMAILSTVPNAHAQETSSRSAEVVIVTATRAETDIQQTPMSVSALDADDLDRVGIDTGRNLGIIVPNVVIASGSGSERQAEMRIRGLPGVTVYIDGIWQGTLGLQQRSFIELDRVEILRGPQGTLFGRNTNGGAVQLITRAPANEFSARFKWELGDHGHRKATAAIDWPINDRLKTKWALAGERSDGYLDNLTTGGSLGQRMTRSSGQTYSGSRAQISRCGSISTAKAARVPTRAACASPTGTIPTMWPITSWPETPTSSIRRGSWIRIFPILR